jgi:hypothetical protein
MALGFFTNNKKHLIAEFAKKAGLVSFGFVDQHSDDHEVVRGLTVSDTHRDNSYVVGSVSGYNVTLVDRSDNVHMPDGKIDKNNWLIMAIHLHTKYRIPHFFVSANNHNVRMFSALFSSFPNMKATELGLFEPYTKEFTTRFTVFARPAKSAEVQQFLTADITRKVAAHFWPLSIEQHDNVLYVYSVMQPVSSGLLDTILENSVWLAGQIDAQATQIKL